MFEYPPKPPKTVSAEDMKNFIVNCIDSAKKDDFNEMDRLIVNVSVLPLINGDVAVNFGNDNVWVIKSERMS
jgi:hypothetical protein